MKSLLTIALLSVSLWSGAQNYWDDENYNPILTNVQYLQLVPDARSAGMGEAGVASSPDAFSMHWNPAKFAFLENKYGIAVSYSDYLWMNLMWKFNDKMDISTGFNTLHACMKIKEKSALAFSFTYFDAFGDITYTDEYGNELGTFKPLDLNLDLAYSYRFSNTFSAALAGRYIYSRMTQDQSIQAEGKGSASSVAFDLAVYYQQPLELGSRDGEIRWGVDVSNIGMKMAYFFYPEKKSFLPTNLRLGAGFTYYFDENNSLSFQFDANKLLVPTPPVYMRDEMGNPVYDEDGNPVVAEGMDPNVTVCKGMIQSWYDAPGGFKEEMHEWAVAGGFEYRYKTFFSARSGIFYEHKTKGNRRYYTAGAGFRVGIFGMDFGLILPLEEKISDSYVSIFYLRSSAAISFGR